MEQEAEWTQEVVWRFWGKRLRKYLVPAENRTRDCPARSLLILPATVTLFAH